MNEDVQELLKKASPPHLQELMHRCYHHLIYAGYTNCRVEAGS